MFELMAALIVFLFPLAYSPGPGNMFFAANGARFGFAATLPASAGYHIATLLVTLAIGLGFETALERSPILFLAIKWAGAVYVLYLAWKMFRAHAIDTGGEARPAGIWGGAVLLLLNPKAYVIIALMFSQFLEAAASSGKAFAVIWITGVFTLNNLLAFTVWTLAGRQIAAHFRDETQARLLNRLFAGVLACVALWMLFG